MSTKDWKNRELPTLLTEKWGFSFNMLTESQEEVVEEAAEDETLNEEEEELEEGMCQQCAPNPCGCRPMEEGEEPELEEGASSSGRAVTPDRGGEDRRANDERKRPMEEAEEKGKYDDGDGKDEKCDHVPCKDQDKKEKMDEQKIRRIIRKLVKEAAAKKAR